MKRILIIFAILVVACSLLIGCNTDVVYDQQLAVDGNFEAGNLSSWTLYSGTSALAPDLKVTTAGSDQGTGYGNYQLELSSGFNADWLYLSQEIPVVENAIYKVEIEIAVSEDLTDSSSSTAYYGAYVAFAEDTVAPHINIKKATTGYTKQIIYVRPIDTDVLNIQLGLGSNKYPTDGVALFDNLVVTRVEAAPADTLIWNVGEDNPYLSTTAGTIYVILLSLLSVGIFVGAYMLILKLRGKKVGELSLKTEDNKLDIKAIFKSPLFILSAILLVGFAIRLYVVSSIYGNPQLINFFSNYASRLWTERPWNFYLNVTESPYTPGYLYVLWALGGAAELLGLTTGSMGMAIFMKIPAVVSDIMIIYIIYNVAVRHFSQYIACVFAGLYALIPVLFTSSAAWGHMEPLVILFVLLTFLAMLDKKYISTIVYFAIALFMRAEVFLLFPIVAGFLIHAAVKDATRKDTVKIIGASSIALIAIIVLSLPFTVKLGGANVLFYTFGRWATAVSGTGLFAENTFNFYAIFGLNGQAVSTFAVVLSWMIYIILIGYVLILYFEKKNRSTLMLLASFMLSATYVFSTAVNIQFMYGAFALGIAYLAISAEKRVFGILGVLALTNFINIAQLLNQSGLIGRSITSNLIDYASNSPFVIVCGVINVLAVMYYALVVYDICYTDDVREIEIGK